MPAPRMMMPAPRITFSDLRRILVDLGFKEVPDDGPQIWFHHEEADLFLGFPPYRGDAIVAPHHLGDARTHLHWTGILEEDDFDRIVLAIPARRRATR